MFTECSTGQAPMAQVLEMGALLISDLIRRTHPELDSASGGGGGAFQAGTNVRADIAKIAEQVRH
jgi:hypothetical protein